MPLPPPPRLIFLPGLGCDHRLFAPQLAAFPNLQVLPWLTPEPRETLPHYAQRMAQSLGPQPAILIGVSFGGMVACEMARHCNARALVLIGSARSGAAIHPLLQLAGRLAAYLPAWLIDATRPLLKALLFGLGASRGPNLTLLKTMFDCWPAPFLQWAASAAVNWRPASPPNVPVFQAHGRHDLMMPLSRCTPDLILDAGHVINLSHPDAVNTFIADCLQSPRI